MKIVQTVGLLTTIGRHAWAIVQIQSQVAVITLYYKLSIVYFQV